jgi:hypothetical protein
MSAQNESPAVAIARAHVEAWSNAPVAADGPSDHRHRRGTAVLGCASMISKEPLVQGYTVTRLLNAEVAAARTGDGRAVRPWI